MKKILLLLLSCTSTAQLLSMTEVAISHALELNRQVTIEKARIDQLTYDIQAEAFMGVDFWVGVLKNIANNLTSLKIQLPAPHLTERVRLERKIAEQISRIEDLFDVLVTQTSTQCFQLFSQVRKYHALCPQDVATRNQLIATLSVIIPRYRALVSAGFSSDLRTLHVQMNAIYVGLGLPIPGIGVVEQIEMRIAFEKDLIKSLLEKIHPRSNLALDEIATAIVHITAHLREIKEQLPVDPEIQARLRFEREIAAQLRRASQLSKEVTAEATRQVKVLLSTLAKLDSTGQQVDNAHLFAQHDSIVEAYNSLIQLDVENTQPQLNTLLSNIEVLRERLGL